MRNEEEKLLMFNSTMVNSAIAELIHKALKCSSLSELEK